MMKKIILIFITLSIVISCKFDEFKDCKEPIIKRVDLVDGNSVGYGYYFYIENYDSRCFNHYYLSYIAEKFMDTLHADKPVGSIYFGSSMKVFNENNIEIYYNKFKNYDGIIFYYSSKKLNSHNKPCIDFIALYSNGREYDIYVPQ